MRKLIVRMQNKLVQWSARHGARCVEGMSSVRENCKVMMRVLLSQSRYQRTMRAGSKIDHVRSYVFLAAARRLGPIRVEGDTKVFGPSSRLGAVRGAKFVLLSL